MRYIIKNIRIPVIDEQDISSKITKLTNQSHVDSQNWSIIRKALDTRKKNFPVFAYTIELNSDKILSQHTDIILSPETDFDKPVPLKLNNPQPIIIGMGPSGLFCALAMVEKGLKPIVFDRGDELSDRASRVSDFWKTGNLDADSNVQFGEGGAGAFSDGKLTSRTSNNTTQIVFDLLVKFGALEYIKWEALPHLGTDSIRNIVANIRNYLISQGCEFIYRSRLEDIIIHNGNVKELVINGNSYSPEIAVLAIGNSARDTFQTLHKRNVDLEAKPFSIGFRISHPQDWINKTIYGSEKWADKLGAASYRLTAPKAGKGSYTFCMCPGGFVIAASSEKNSSVTNGMSYSSRSNSWGNSAIVTNIDSSDYGSDIMDGVIYQRQIEQNAYLKGYAAPYQLAIDYLNESLSKIKDINCLYPTIKPIQISDLFSKSVNLALKQALDKFDHVLPGFIKNGYLIAPETRTSSPIRILRDNINHNCINVNNLYAIGEGAGYSGGIISSAADGYKIGSKFSI